jgi:hypothetical protein
MHEASHDVALPHLLIPPWTTARPTCSYVVPTFPPTFSPSPLYSSALFYTGTTKHWQHDDARTGTAADPRLHGAVWPGRAHSLHLSVLPFDARPFRTRRDVPTRVRCLSRKCRRGPVARLAPRDSAFPGRRPGGKCQHHITLLH